MPSREVNFADRRQVARRIRKAAGAAAQVHFVFSNCQQRLRNVGPMQRRLTEIQGLAVIRHPVVLHRNAGEVRAGAYDLHAKGTFQLACSNAQRSVWATTTRRLLGSTNAWHFTPP